MADDPDLVQFILAYIKSVWALELLLLLRSDPGRQWQPDALVRELRASTSLVQDNLSLFERCGLAVREGAVWRFAPASAHLAELTTRLAETYRERPMATIGLISRTSPVQSLADAFKLKKDEP
jgi:hypothetical protein